MIRLRRVMAGLSGRRPGAHPMWAMDECAVIFHVCV